MTKDETGQWTASRGWGSTGLGSTPVPHSQDNSERLRLIVHGRSTTLSPHYKNLHTAATSERNRDANVLARSQHDPLNNGRYRKYTTTAVLSKPIQPCPRRSFALIEPPQKRLRGRGSKCLASPLRPSSPHHPSCPSQQPPPSRQDTPQR